MELLKYQYRKSKPWLWLLPCGACFLLAGNIRAPPAFCSVGPVLLGSGTRRDWRACCGGGIGRRCSAAHSEDSALAEDGADPHRWLEEVDSPRALSWVVKQNTDTLSSLGDPRGSPIYRSLLNTETTDVDQDPLRKLPQVSKIGDFYYDFWLDARHPRGIWRRTTLEEFLRPAPAWEVVLSLDNLSSAEGESWVWRGFLLLDEGPEASPHRAMVQLSRGGADAVVAREFHLLDRRFVPPDEGGFVLPEAKTMLSYRSHDVLLVSSSLGAGFATKSGYPSTVRAWRRWTPFESARVVFRGQATDHVVYGYSIRDRQGQAYEVVHQATSFYEATRFMSIDGGRHFTRLEVPSDAELSFFSDSLILQLGSDFAPPGEKPPFAAGSLLAARAEDALQGVPGCWKALWRPREEDPHTAREGATPRFSTLRHVAATRNHLVLVVLSNVRSSIVVLGAPDAGRKFGEAPAPQVVDVGAIASLSIRPVDPMRSDALWVGGASYTEPPSLFYIRHAGSWGASGASWESLTSGRHEAGLAPVVEKVRELEPQFDATGLQMEQLWAVSRDGTRVPYLLIRGRGHTIESPTLLYAYGGFEIPVLPRYQGSIGAGWLERGGAYVEANIRGGGEFGPAWGRVARKAGRVKSYEDLEAVAEDLCRRGVTQPKRLALFGRSNGGLLVGNMLVRSPERFGALVAEVPLLDMRVYHRLLAGASWLAEYGDPEDPSEWLALRRISPYHMVADQAASDPDVRYPPVLFTTSTRDDRVHPAHARKMVRRLQELPQVREAYLFEAPEGGHCGATTLAGRAFLRTMQYEFLWSRVSEA